jgi:hypothetical protein
MERDSQLNTRDGSQADPAHCYKFHILQPNLQYTVPVFYNIILGLGKTTNSQIGRSAKELKIWTCYQRILDKLWGQLKEGCPPRMEWGNLSASVANPDIFVGIHLLNIKRMNEWLNVERLNIVGLNIGRMNVERQNIEWLKVEKQNAKKTKHRITERRIDWMSKIAWTFTLPLFIVNNVKHWNIWYMTKNGYFRSSVQF